jgi:hypothetical protein
MKLSKLSRPTVQAPAVRTRVGTLLAALLLILASVHLAAAQQLTPTSNDTNETINRLNKRLEELETRLKELEAKQANADARSTTAPATTPAEAAPEEAKAQPIKKTTTTEGTAGTAGMAGMEGMPGMPTELPTMKFNGFTDIQYHASNGKGEKNSFALGQFDLTITSRLSEKLSMLAELNFEASDDNKFGVDLERMLLQYSPNDHFKLDVGRYHTAIGFYNTAYHHGSWFQTAIDRPFIFAFEDEGGILPLHNVGLSATGQIPSGRFGLRYIAEIGNGRTSRSPFDEPVQDVKDENNGKAFNLGLITRPDWLPGLQAGISVYRDRLAPEGLPKIGQTIGAVHVVYLGRTFEFLNEAIVVRHQSAGTPRPFNTTSFYTQVARKFGDFQPYFRYQYLNAPASEPIFKDVGRRSGPSLGLRYDLSEFAAFKVQYDRDQRRGLRAVNKIGMQLAFTF